MFDPSIVSSRTRKVYDFKGLRQKVTLNYFTAIVLVVLICFKYEDGLSNGLFKNECARQKVTLNYFTAIFLVVLIFCKYEVGL